MNLSRACGLCAFTATAMLSCATVRDQPPPTGSIVSCTKIDGLPGPDDLALDRWHKPPRLLVSSYDRWGHAAEGEIYAIDPNTDQRSAPLIRQGEPAAGEPGHFAFRPQGMDLWKSPQGDLLMAVAVHGTDTGRDQAVVLYKLKGDTLEYVEAIRDHKWLVDPSDVAFSPDGKLYVTNFGEAGRAPWTYVFNRPASTLVMCDPAKPERRCSPVARNISGGHGVIVRKGKVIAASFFGGYLFDVERSKIDGQIFLRRFVRVPYPDNMTIAEDQTVLVASQAMPAMALHAQVKASAPSAIYRLDPETDSPSPSLLFQDNGETIQGASAAVWYQRKLYLGQTFGTGVVVVPMPETGLDGVLHCAVPSPAPADSRSVAEGTPREGRSTATP